jgi:hypothetical protein
MLVLLNFKFALRFLRQRVFFLVKGLKPKISSQFKIVLILCLFVFTTSFRPGVARADQVSVRHLEGVTHGFLILRTLDGKAIADGDLRQEAKAGRVTDHLTFRFKDGSLFKETTIFTEHGQFRLIYDQMIQKGPSFKHPVESSIDAVTGRVTVKSDEKGKEKIVSEKLALPADIYNGLAFTVLKNISPNAQQTRISMVAGSPKPRIVQVNISRQGAKTFAAGEIKHEATDYVLKVEIGGMAGVAAKLTGKQPPDTHVWILDGEAPAFLASEGPFYEDGPIWRIELAAPSVSDN